MRIFALVLISMLAYLTPMEAPWAVPGDASVAVSAPVPPSAAPAMLPDAAVVAPEGATSVAPKAASAAPVAKEALKEGATSVAPKAATPDEGLLPYFKLIKDAAAAGNWKLAVVLVLVLLIWATRKYGSKIPGPLGGALASDAGGVVVAFFWAFLGTLSAALTLGVNLDLHLVGEALLLAFTAMGGWVALKKLLPASWVAKMPWLFEVKAP